MNKRKSNKGRKPLNPNFDSNKNLEVLMNNVVELYKQNNSLQSIADTLNLNPIKVRKLLITANVYESDKAKKVNETFNHYLKDHDYKTAKLLTASLLKLSKASVTSYLPYKKGIYFTDESMDKISVNAKRQKRYRSVKKLRDELNGKNLWEVILLYQNMKIKTYSGLIFSYEVKKGKNGEYTKELWVNRKEKSKSISWSSVLLALNHIKEIGAIVERPKALGDLFGVTYIYGMFYRFGIIDVPIKVKDKMK